MAYTDGTFTSFKQVGATRISFPFLNAQIKDKTTKRYDITGMVMAANYVAANANTTYPGDGVFSADNTAYLVEETAPAATRGAYMLDRIYCTIPSDQIEYTSALFVRPVMNDIVSGNTYAATFDDGKTSHLFNVRQNITAIGGLTLGTTNVNVAAENYALLPTTNFTIYDSAGSGTTQPLSTDAATLQSTLVGALTALNSVSVSSTVGALTVSWVGTVKSIGTTSTGVTMSGGAGLNGSVTFTAGQSLVTDTQIPAADTSTRTLTIANHGGNPGDRVALWNGAKLIAATEVVTSAANTFAVPLDALPGANANVTHAQFAKSANYCYVCGPKECSVRRTTKFYLPGVSPNITTGADIPVVATYADPDGWLSKIVASANYTAIATADLGVFMGPILKKSYDEVQMADALESRTP